MVRRGLITGAMLWAVACGSSEDVPVDAGVALADAAGHAGTCPPGEFATAITEAGVLLCAPIEEAVVAAIASHCAVYLGWQDSCDGCTALPGKWGRVSIDSCEDGAGAGNSCADTDLGGVVMPLLGIDLDGDVNDDDKFHIGLECAPPADEPTPGPCPPGSYLAAAGDAGTQCVTAAGAIVEYLAGGCEILYGWRDSCDGCTGEPAKWGRAGSEACAVEAGADSTCTSFRLGGAPVFTLGINTDGDVNGDDKFYLGLRCGGAAPAESTRPDACPAGQLVVGVDDSGVSCASPVPAAEAFVQQRCFLYHGWRDECDGCAAAPSKWGRVGHAGCENGAGNDNTCASTPLDGTSVELFGLNTDGDVDGNDKLYMGLACP